MTYRLYRLTLLHERVHQALHSELARKTPSALRLLRLRGLKLSIMDRLTRVTHSPLVAT